MPDPARSRTRSLARVGGIAAILVAAIGVAADTTSLIESESVRDFVSAVLPYGSAVLALAMVGLAYRENRRVRSLRGELDRRRELDIRVVRRLVRVLGAGEAISQVADVDPNKLQSLFDELVGALPDGFGSHHKFSVARPNKDGTFTLMATRGMDPASVSSIQSKASWMTGRSFYASLLNDPQRAEFKLFSTSDTAYVDTRTAGDSASRPSSSSAHFLIGLRDEDIYQELPKQTLGIISIGIPKGMELSSDEQESLFLEVLPVVKAIESVLVAESLRERSTRIDGSASSD